MDVGYATGITQIIMGELGDAIDGSKTLSVAIGPNEHIVAARVDVNEGRRFAVRVQFLVYSE